MSYLRTLRDICTAILSYKAGRLLVLSGLMYGAAKGLEAIATQANHGAFDHTLASAMDMRRQELHEKNHVFTDNDTRPLIKETPFLRRSFAELYVFLGNGKHDKNMHFTIDGTAHRFPCDMNSVHSLNIYFLTFAQDDLTDKAFLNRAEKQLDIVSDVYLKKCGNTQSHRDEVTKAKTHLKNSQSPLP